MIPCVLSDHPSNVVKRVGNRVSSGDPIAFQQDNDITHVEVPSSMTVLPIMCFTYTTLIWKAT
jgi:hypothetical protein